MAKYSGEITLAKVQDGSSGVSCTGSTTTYQVGTSGTVKPTGTWSSNIPAVSAGEYLWIKTTLSYSDASSSDIYSVSYMGTNGSQGVAGIDGKTAFVHIRFSAVANPTTASQISITPDKYIGLCTNNSSTAPTSPSDYTWSKFQGDDGQDGAQGIPGANGADGTTYYVHFAYADSSDGQTGFSTTVSANKSYIGQCVNTSQADPTDYSKYKWSLIKGADGVGISSITEHYAVSSSSTTAPTSWSLTPPVMSATNKYLWNYETITYSDSTSMDTKKRVIGIYGDKGQTGSSGKGISSVVNYYLATSSSTGVTTSTSGWTTTVQNVTATNKNLWNYEVITYTDNSTTTTVPCIIGVYGDKGDKGDTGQGIDSITPEYYVSTSNTTQTGGSWSTTMPAWAANKYCWVRNKIVYKNPASTVYTTAQLDTNWNKMNDLDSKTTVLQTTVTQEQGKLAALIKQTDTDRKNTSDKFTQVTADINGINTTIGSVQTKVDNLKVGGRNYWIQSAFDADTYKVTNRKPSGSRVPGWFADLKAVIVSDPDGNYCKLKPAKIWNCAQYFNFTDGEKWTISFEARAATDNLVGKNVAINTDLLNIHPYPVGALSKDWKKYSLTFDAVGTGEERVHIRCLTGTGTDNDELHIRKIKLEKGNMATDWTPAPEDTDAQFTTINSQITTINATAAGLETKVTKAQNDATAAQSKATQAADKIGLVVQSGTSQSNLTLTPEALSAIANNIDLTGKVTFNSLDSATQNRLDNNNILSIQIVSSYSGNTCTLTAHVYKGQTELTDTQVIALGALKWYSGDTFISNGKQLTRTVTSRETLECRLESGGGLMPEFITLADGSLAVKGRNLLYQSCPLVVGNWNNNGALCAMDSETTYDGKPTLKTVLGGGIRYYPIPRTTHSENVEDWVPMVPGQTYTYSMCLKAEGTVAHGWMAPLHWHFKNSNGEANQSPTFISNGGTITVGEWSIIWTKFRSNHKWMRPFIYTGQNPSVTVNIAWIKLEYGDEMTGPSAAPEDEEVN